MYRGVMPMENQTKRLYSKVWTLHFAKELLNAELITEEQYVRLNALADKELNKRYGEPNWE